MTQENALKIFKSLSDMSRLRIVQSLTQGDMYRLSDIIGQSARTKSLC